MDFKLISKNNVGGAIFLLLIIALSQAKAFNFLMDTALGRIFLIVFILSLSHCHKILGVVGVLLIVIMFNSNMYYEGFENKSTSTTTTDASANSVDPSSNSTTTLNADQIKQMIQQQISAAAASNNNSSSDSTTDSSSSTTTVTKKPNNSTGAEGFDILGIENNIKRGKQSNSIPVNNFMRDADSIMPYDGTSFLGSFSPF